jgi:ribosomal protein S17E
MIDSFERGYYEETLPNFISGYLERYMKRKMQYNINSIGYL